MHAGELSGMGAELLLRFHTSSKERPRYTIQTHGDVDMILALLGPDDYTKQIRLDVADQWWIQGWFFGLLRILLERISWQILVATLTVEGC